MRLSRGVLAGAVAVCVASSHPVRGQTAAPPYVEYRADVLVGRETTTQAGVGAVVPLGIYVRLGVDGAAGVTWRDGSTHPSGRVDAIGRFLLDPFREMPVALSFGGGVSVPYADGDPRVRPYLTAVIDVEGRARGTLTPALQVGLGGGARVGLVLRTSPARWR